MKRFLLLGGLMGLCVWMGCTGPEVSPEELARRKAISQARRESAPFEESGRYEEAIKVWKKVVKRYPNSPEAYRKISEIAQEKCRLDEKDNRPHGPTYVTAIENAAAYVKALSPKSKEYSKALEFLGKTIELVFSGVPIPQWDEAVQALEPILGDLSQSNLKEAKYALGMYYLYRYRLSKAEELLEESQHMSAAEPIKLLRKLQKEGPVSPIGKKLVFRTVLRRGDSAAFFYHEMKSLQLKEEHRIPTRYLPGSEIADLENFWAKKEMEYCLTLGVIRLLSSTKAFPNLPIQRIEVAILAINTMRVYYRDLNLLEKYRASLRSDTFSDPPEHFDTAALTDESPRPYAAGAVQEGFLTMGKDRKFRPSDSVSGYEFFQVLVKLKEKLLKKGS